jgi:cysteine-rich repeat protein
MSKHYKGSLRARSMNLPVAKVLAGLGAALVLAGPSTALAQSKQCTVQFTVTSATALGALQLGVDYAGAGDVGDFAVDGCTIVPSGLTDVSIDAPSDELGVGWANTTAFNGPALFASCAFVLPDSTDPDPVAGDFVVSVEDASNADVPPTPVSPTIGVAVTGCTPVASDCQNGVVEGGEDCDDGNALGGDGCGPTCANTGSCAAAPLSGCRVSATPAKSKLSFNNDIKNPGSNVKDKGSYDWKLGAATDLADFEDPMTVGSTYQWCVYDNGVSVRGSDVPSVTGWKAAGTTGFLFKGDKDGVSPISMIKLKAGVAGKSLVQVKAKSKLGNFASPALPLSTTVVSQFVIDDGATPLCFETEFGTAKKNTTASYIAVGAP